MAPRTIVRTFLVMALLAVPALPCPAADEDGGSPELERAVARLVAACSDEIDRYCRDVTPGEGHLLACLYAYEDRLSPACRAAYDMMERPVVHPRLRGAPSVPSLEGRKLGEQVREDGGKGKVWDHPLPIWGQRVVDLGFDLPFPFGISVLPVWMRQDAVVSDLAIAVGDGDYTEIDFVDFGHPYVETATLQVKFDAWLLPFLNLYAVVGELDGEATVPMSIEGRDMFPGLCTVSPEHPVCLRRYETTAVADYRGETFSLGFNLAAGWKKYFVTLPVTWTWSDIDILDDAVTTLNISPRIGVTGDVGKDGLISIYIGMSYLGVDSILRGSVTFDTPDSPYGPTTTVRYRLRQKNRDQWNSLLGVNWDITKRWSVLLEAGFGGSRSSVITAATWRF